MMYPAAQKLTAISGRNMRSNRRSNRNSLIARVTSISRLKKIKLTLRTVRISEPAKPGWRQLVRRFDARRKNELAAVHRVYWLTKKPHIDLLIDLESGS